MRKYQAPNGNLIVAIKEAVPCAVEILGIGADGTEVEYGSTGSTMFWDDAEPVKRDGKFIFLDEDGGEWAFDQLTAKPEASSPTPVPDLRTYSFIINWNDRDTEQGTFGTTVRAASPDQAEALARAEMRLFHVNNYGEDKAEGYEDDDGTFGGSVVECSEGAAWKAVEMEAVLRLLAGDLMDLDTAIQSASKIIAEIDGIGAEG